MTDKDTDSCVMQAESNRGTDSVDEREPTVTIPRYAARTALRVAEGAAGDITRTLREAERQRDDLARKLGDVQRKVDALTGEMRYRTRHVSDLSAALS